MNPYDKPLMTVDEDEFALNCPNCGNQSTHIDWVRMNDAAGNCVQLKAGGEDDSSRITVEMPVLTKAYDGRRHTVHIGGLCEICGIEFAWSFKQHKGMTYTNFTAIPRPVDEHGVYQDLDVELPLVIDREN